MIKTLPSNAQDAGSIPGQGAKIPQAWGPRKSTQNRSNVTYNKDFKNGPYQKNLFKKNTLRAFMRENF